jgi:hypothetical protein
MQVTHGGLVQNNAPAATVAICIAPLSTTSRAGIPAAPHGIVAAPVASSSSTIRGATSPSSSSTPLIAAAKGKRKNQKKNSASEANEGLDEDQKVLKVVNDLLEKTGMELLSEFPTQVDTHKYRSADRVSIALAVSHFSPQWDSVFNSGKSGREIGTHASYVSPTGEWMVKTKHDFWQVLSVILAACGELVETQDAVRRKPDSLASQWMSMDEQFREWKQLFSATGNQNPDAASISNEDLIRDQAAYRRKHPEWQKDIEWLRIMKDMKNQTTIEDDALALNDGDGLGSYAADPITAFEKQLARRQSLEGADEEDGGQEDVDAVASTPQRIPSIGDSSKKRKRTEGVKTRKEDASSSSPNLQHELILLLKERWNSSRHDEDRTERKRQSFEAHELDMERKRMKRNREALMLEEQRLKIALLKRQLGDEQ